ERGDLRERVDVLARLVGYDATERERRARGEGRLVRGHVELQSQELLARRGSKRSRPEARLARALAGDGLQRRLDRGGEGHRRRGRGGGRSRCGGGGGRGARGRSRALDRTGSRRREGRVGIDDR